MVASAESQRTVRLLMAVWDGALSQGSLIKKVKKSGKTAKDYQPILEHLTQYGMLSISGEKSGNLPICRVSKDYSKRVIAKPLYGVTMQCNPIF
jgi:hypothetical protein